MKILAIDHGTKNIGLAISDELEITARPLPQLKNSDSALHNIAELCVKEKIEKIVIGLPTGAVIKNSKQEKIVKEFAKDLFEITMLPILLWDESYSSQNARKKTKKNIDSESAKIILQEYLDSPDKKLDHGLYEK